MKRRKKLSERKRSKKNDYFTDETDVSIIKFIRARSIEKKNKIFEQEIKKSFTTLVNNLIFVYKVGDLDTLSSLRDDCVRFLYQKIETYNPKKASKAFSYFNVVARNWLWQRFNSNKKDEKKFVSIDENHVANALITKSKDEFDNENNVFFDHNFIEFLIRNMEEIKSSCKEREQIVLDATITILENPEQIDIFNKKAIFIYLRNMTGLNAKQIILALNKLKVVYYDLKQKWVANRYEI